MVARYLVLIYEDEAEWDAGGPEVMAATLEGHRAFGAANGGAVVAGDALERTGTATSVRQDDRGEFVLTDGPFVETKEALGGYYLIEAADLDEALALAKQIPAPFGGVEVRPIRTFD
jgi:hypothetical protein